MFKKQRDIGEKIVEKVRSEEIQLLAQKLSEWDKLFGVTNPSISDIHLISKQFMEWKEKGPFGLSNLIHPWVSSSNNSNPFIDIGYKDDPIHGCVRLEPEILSLYHHPIVERLDHIRQLSFAFGYPSSTHTRLSHSLGVVYLMEEALTTIFRKNKIYSITEESPIFLSKEKESSLLLTAKAVSLLHDIGHGPFSHTIDRYIGFHKDISEYPDKVFSFEYLQKYLKDVIKESELDFEDISEILDKEKSKSGYNQLITNILDSSLDVDRMDYLVRDAHFSGLPIGEINTKRLIECMVPFRNEDDTVTLAYSEESIPHIKLFLFARNSMYTNCYEHPAKLAAERMIVKAVDDIIINNYKEKIDLDYMKLLADDQLLNFILVNSNPTADCFKLTRALLAGEIFEEIYRLDISDFVKKPDEPTKTKPIEVKNFLKDFVKRSRKTTYIDQIRIREKILAEESGIDDSWKVAVYLPPPETMSTSEIGINILRKKDKGFEVVEIGDASPDVQNLFNLIRNERLKIRVFVSPTLPNYSKEKIRQKSKELYESS